MWGIGVTSVILVIWKPALFNDVDVAIFGLPDRRLYKNLTKGLTNKYRYLVAQGLTVGPAEGRDLAYSPDGNYVAVFGRTERVRSLFLLDVLT